MEPGRNDLSQHEATCTFHVAIPPKILQGVSYCDKLTAFANNVLLFLSELHMLLPNLLRDLYCSFSKHVQSEGELCKMPSFQYLTFGQNVA